MMGDSTPQDCKSPVDIQPVLSRLYIWSSCKEKKIKQHIYQAIIAFSPISSGHAGEPGPGDITILSNAFSSYKYRQMSLHVHSSLRTTTGGTGTVTQHKGVKTMIILACINIYDHKDWTNQSMNNHLSCESCHHFSSGPDKMILWIEPSLKNDTKQERHNLTDLTIMTLLAAKNLIWWSNRIAFGN